MESSQLLLLLAVFFTGIPECKADFPYSMIGTISGVLSSIIVMITIIVCRCYRRRLLIREAQQRAAMQATGAVVYQQQGPGMQHSTQFNYGMQQQPATAYGMQQQPPTEYGMQKETFNDPPPSYPGTGESYGESAQPVGTNNQEPTSPDKQQ